MILLIDNYDSFTYNLAQYIGNFAEVKVLRNDDAGLYQAAEEADALVLSPGPGWPADAGRMEELIRDFAGKKPILGICLGHQAIAEVFGGKLGLAPKVMHGKQSILIARLLPFVSFDIVSYAAGLSGMSFWGFFIATGIGQTPATLVYSYVGGFLTGGAKWLVTGLLILFALAFMIALGKQLYEERLKKKDQADGETAKAEDKA